MKLWLKGASRAICCGTILLASVAVSCFVHAQVQSQYQKQTPIKQGTFAAPKIEHVGVLGDDGLTVRRTVFSYHDGDEEVVGTTTSVHFILEYPVATVWPFFQDFNLWQSGPGFSFSGEFGDKEGELEFLIYHQGQRDRATIDGTMAFVVQQLIPEHAIVLHSPAWESVDSKGNRLGSRHEGKNVFMLAEVDGNTVVTATMEHAYHYYGAEAKRTAAVGLKQRIKVAKARKKDVWESFVPALKAHLDGSEAKSTK